MTDHADSTPAERLREARERAGYKTAKSFADVVGVKPVTYRAYEGGFIGFANMAPRFASKLKVDTDWLMTGRAKSAPKLTLVQSHPEVETAMLRQVDISYAMGDGAIVDDYPETGAMPFSIEFLRAIGISQPDSAFVCRGEGDSMSPTIFDSDLVMVDQSRRRVTMQDRIWALTVAGAGMIKRLRMLPSGEVLVLSDNPLVPEQVCAADEIHVVGKVVWIARRL